MQNQCKRWLAMFMAAMLAIGCLLGGALAETGDWRDMLRDAFGLSDEEKQTEVWDDESELGSGQTEVYEREWTFPITDPQDIVDYLYLYGELPENFITKNEAKALGWDSRYNYVGEVAPGKSIGGDRFGNYEGLLPRAKGRQWYECDANYSGRKRGAERVLYSSDGLFYYTNDHYETFTEMFPEVEEE